MRLVTGLQSGCLLYLFQNTSVLYWDPVPLAGLLEEEEQPELAEEKLETDEALERNEKVDSRDFLFTALLRWLGWLGWMLN